MLSDFNTIDNTLSIYEFQDSENDLVSPQYFSEEKRMVVNYEIGLVKYLSISSKLQYVKISKEFLDNLNLTIKQTPAPSAFDELANKRHYDIVNLDSEKLTEFVFQLNNEINSKKIPIINVIQKNLKKDILTSIQLDYLNLRGKNEFLINEYKEKLKN